MRGLPCSCIPAWSYRLVLVVGLVDANEGDSGVDAPIEIAHQVLPGLVVARERTGVVLGDEPQRLDGADRQSPGISPVFQHPERLGVIYGVPPGALHVPGRQVPALVQQFQVNTHGRLLLHYLLPATRKVSATW